MAFQDTINGKNLKNIFGLIIQTGTERLLEFPERKESLSNDWEDENGKEYDLAAPKFKDKEVSITCIIIADNDTQFWNYHQLFLAELQLPNYQSLFIEDHGKTYQVFYKKSNNFRKISKRLKGVLKVVVKFEIVLQVQ